MASAAIDRAFVALADGTRRAVVERLRHGPRRAGELAAELAVRAPTLTRHLRILREAQLVHEQVADDDARARVYTLRRDAFAQLRTWVDGIEALWQEQLTAFAEHVHKRTGKAK
ncbi:MAG: winged helix-turn-helix transcriptional regulator [Planctomycetes bacterium]|nr:winged helix-turn-helix transcriptional regulator [Planctomycetota bacterium]